jgi:CarD family transcriptional regulator
VNSLFQIGDKIVYPMHGAGVIETIEEREILGEKQQYYVIKMPVTNMQIMVPVEKASNVGIRPVVDIFTLEKVLLTFHHEESEHSLSWSQRYGMNMDKIRTGDVQKGMEVVRDLTHLKKKKILNASEMRMLDNARKILISELMVVKGITKNQANDWLNHEMNR